MKKYVQILLAAAMGAVLASAGLTWTDWQFYVVMIVAAGEALTSYAQGWEDAMDRAVAIVDRDLKGLFKK